VNDDILSKQMITKGEASEFSLSRLFYHTRETMGME
jgi:hypothetical protein